MSVYESKCPQCGADLPPTGQVVTCTYCGGTFTRQTQPAGIAPRKPNFLMKILKIAVPITFLVFFVATILPYPWNYIVYQICQYTVLGLVFLAMIVTSLSRRAR